MFDLQTQVAHRIAGGSEFLTHRAGKAQTGHPGGKAFGVEAPDDGRHQVFGAAHRQAHQQMQNLEAPGRQPWIPFRHDRIIAKFLRSCGKVVIITISSVPMPNSFCRSGP